MSTKSVQMRGMYIRFRPKVPAGERISKFDSSSEVWRKFLEQGYYGSIIEQYNTLSEEDKVAAKGHLNDI